MDSEASLPCSQEPATSLYLVPDESNPQLQSIDKITSNIKVLCM